MKRGDAKRELKALGVKITSGSKHDKLYYNGKQSVLPRHNEISDQLFKVIKKQLGIK